MFVAFLALASGAVQKTPGLSVAEPPPGFSDGVQIGLNPLITWGGGIILWLAFVLQATCLPKRGKHGILGQVRRDMTWCCFRQSGTTVFLCETSLFWFDFVSDLAILLGAWFPNVVLFTLMWVFFGCQLGPYTVLVFIIRPPKGWTYLQPPAVLLDTENMYAAPIVNPAARSTAHMAIWAWQRFHGVLMQCWDSSCPAFVGIVGAMAWCMGGCLVGAGLLVCCLCGWVIVIVLAVLFVGLWIAAWVLLLVIWTALRVLLFAFGFTLYVAMLMPFPDAPATQLFYRLWCELDLTDKALKPADVEATELAEFRLLEPGAVRSLSFQGVNIFTLHWTYIADLFENMAQVVVQILVACLGVWTWSLMLSIAISLLVVAMYGYRYVYWLVIRPYLDDRPWQEELVALHLYYYDRPRPEMLKNSRPDDDGYGTL